MFTGFGQLYTVRNEISERCGRLRTPTAARDRNDYKLVCRDGSVNHFLPHTRERSSHPRKSFRAIERRRRTLFLSPS